MGCKTREGNHKWWVLVAMITNMSMLFIDSTILPVALPTIQKELGLSELTLQWLVNSYLLSLTVFLIAGGRLADLFGRRRICAIGLLVFSFSSVLCAFSNSGMWFILSRALQGVGGALLLPSTSATVLSAFPPHERGRAMGINLSAGAVFLSIGPLVGGLLTQYLSWRFAFWINLPISALGLLFLFLFVPKSESQKETFDGAGFLTLAAGTSALVVAMMQVPEWGWSWQVFSLLLIGCSLIGALVVIDRKTPHPFVDFSFFRSSRFLAATICIFLAQFLMMITIFWTLFFQHIVGYSPSVAGLVTLVANSPVLVMAPVAGHLTDKVGPRIPAMIGFSLVFIGLIWFEQIPDQATFISRLPALLIYGSGIPLVFNPCFVSSMNEVPSRKWGSASALRQAIRQLGGTIGMAVMGSLFLHNLSKLLIQRFQTTPQTEALNPVEFEGILSHTPNALEALKELPLTTAGAVKEIYISSYTTAFHMINIFSAALAVIGFCIAFRFLSKKPTIR